MQGTAYFSSKYIKSLLDNAPNYLVGPKEISIAQWAKIRKHKKTNFFA